MTFLAITETGQLDYLDVDFVEAMEIIYLQDFSFKPIKDLPTIETRGEGTVENKRMNIMTSSCYRLLNRLQPIKEVYPPGIRN